MIDREKINSERPVPAKASREVASGVGKRGIRTLAGQWDEARWWERRQSTPVPGYPGPERCRRRESATSGSIHLQPPSSSKGVWYPQREGGSRDPSTFPGGLLSGDSGKTELFHLVTSHCLFLPLFRIKKGEIKEIKQFLS